MALEEVKFLQRQRQRKSGIPALTVGNGNGNGKAEIADTHQFHFQNKVSDQTHITQTSSAEVDNDKDKDKDKDKDDLVLQDTFAQETAVMVEDPNMYVCMYIIVIIWNPKLSYLLSLFDNRLKYVEQELAKKRGRKIDATDQLEKDLKHAEDELYKIPDHLKVSEWVI